MPDKDFTFEIEEHFGVISSREGGWNKELNLVRWNGAAAKYDIREWDEHHEQMHRGITLSPWEMRNLVDLFVSRNNHAAVARGRAIEAGRSARRLAARQKAGQAQQAELEAIEGTVPPLAEEKTGQAESQGNVQGKLQEQESLQDNSQENFQENSQEAPQGQADF